MFTKSSSEQEPVHADTVSTGAKTQPIGAQAEVNAEQTKPTQDSLINQSALTPQVRKAMQSKLLAANFGNIVTVMMQTQQYKDTPLSQLRDVVVPAVLADQATIAEAYDKRSGYTVPVGFALWARVSDEVDQRLSQNPTKPIELKADEWRSGDNFWLVELVGPMRFVRQMVKGLDERVFKGQPVKFSSLDKDGNRSIELLKRANEKPEAEASPMPANAGPVN